MAPHEVLFTSTWQTSDQMLIFGGQPSDWSTGPNLLIIGRLALLFTCLVRWWNEVECGDLFSFSQSSANLWNINISLKWRTLKVNLPNFHSKFPNSESPSGLSDTEQLVKTVQIPSMNFMEKSTQHFVKVYPQSAHQKVCPEDPAFHPLILDFHPRLSDLVSIAFLLRKWGSKRKLQGDLPTVL